MTANLMASCPVSDLHTLLLAAKAKLLVESTGGKKFIDIDEKFFIGYRKNIISPEEVIVKLELPYTTEVKSPATYKNFHQCFYF